MDAAKFGISNPPLEHEPYLGVRREDLKNTNNGKTALITGAGGGIGSAIATGIAETGADVALLDLSAGALERTKELCKQAGVRVRIYICDITQLESLKTIVQQVEQDLNRIDILVNCAGVLVQRPMAMETFEGIWRQVEVNFKGTLGLTYVVLPGMRERRSGCVINIASRAGTVDVPMCVGYNTGKAAVIRLTHTLQAEMALDGLDDCIQFYALHPGGVWTGIANTASPPA